MRYAFAIQTYHPVVFHMASDEILGLPGSRPYVDAETQNVLFRLESDIAAYDPLPDMGNDDFACQSFISDNFINRHEFAR